MRGGGLCSTPACSKKEFARGLCYSEWRRWHLAQPPSWRERFIREHPPKDGIGLVPLSRGKVAIVDAEDYERVIAHTWWFNGRHPSARIDGKHVTLPHFLLQPKGKN